MYYTDDFYIPSSAQVIQEELKHVAATHELVKKLVAAGSFLEQTDFGNEWACKLECTAFKLWADTGLKLANWVDDQKSGFHPDMDQYATKKH